MSPRGPGIHEAHIRVGQDLSGLVERDLGASAAATTGQRRSRAAVREEREQSEERE